MNKKSIIITLLTFITPAGYAQTDNRMVIARTEGSITFVVDKGLRTIEDKYRYLYDGEGMAKAILASENIPRDAYHIIATSFSDARNLTQSSKDVFFQTIKNGHTLNSFPLNKRMPSEHVRVGFKYRVVTPEQGTVISETPMELWAGFIGAEEDTITNTLTPKIGWLVCVAAKKKGLCQH